MKANKTYLFEVLIGSAPAAGQKYNFPNNLGQLNNVKVMGIEVYSADQLIKGPDSFATTVASAGLKSAVLVVVDSITEHLRYIPLVDLVPQLNGGLQREFVPFVANISKSYIMAVAATSLNLNEVFLVNWLYENVNEAKK